MSQISHTQLALKKRNSTGMSDHENQKDKKSHTNGSNNASKSDDKDVIVIDDDYETIPVGREEVIEEQMSSFEPEVSPIRKKRGRKPKASTDSRDSIPNESSNSKNNSDLKKANADDIEKEIDEELLKHVFADELTAQAMPPSKETKVLKLIADSLPASQNQRRSDRLQNASTIVNLSTVSISEQSTKLSNDTMKSSNTEEETPSKIGERRVSGRRSTRPIDDIKFSYRSPNPDDSLNATTNATIGSEIADSMLETPAQDRKRRFDSMENIDSPKRSRLDLSSLFSNFTSPVAALRNKFRKANLASTPKFQGNVDDSTVSIDTSASEMKEIDLNEKSDDNVAPETGVTANTDENAQVSVEKPAKKSSCSIM